MDTFNHFNFLKLCYVSVLCMRRCFIGYDMFALSLLKAKTTIYRLDYDACCYDVVNCVTTLSL
jgi:hypothetical protein